MAKLCLMSAIVAECLLTLMNCMCISVAHHRRTTVILYYHRLLYKRRTVFAIAIAVVNSINISCLSMEVYYGEFT